MCSIVSKFYFLSVAVLASLMAFPYMRRVDISFHFKHVDIEREKTAYECELQLQIMTKSRRPFAIISNLALHIEHIKEEIKMTSTSDDDNTETTVACNEIVGTAIAHRYVLASNE